MHKVMTPDGQIIVPKYHQHNSPGGNGGGHTTGRLQNFFAKSKKSSSGNHSHVPQLTSVPENGSIESDEVHRYDEEHPPVIEEEEVSVNIDKIDLDSYETPLQVYRRKMSLGKVGKEAAAAASTASAMRRVESSGGRQRSWSS